MKSFTIKAPKIKKRGVMPPPCKVFKDHKAQYSRAEFKNRNNW